MAEETENKEIKESPGLALGIDFGNSKISGAVWNSNKKAPSIVTIDKKYQFPATLYFKNTFQRKESDQNSFNLDSNCFEIGTELSMDKDINYFIYDIKKLLGQKNTDEMDKICQNLKYKDRITTDQEDNIAYNFEENLIHFEEFSKILIKKIKIEAEYQFKDVVNSCTISVPHGFNNNQRAAIKNAASEAGIKNIFIINEPLSTAIYYVSKNKIQKNENILIIDFGSSKIDVTLLSINNKNSIKVRFSMGDSSLGGDIFNTDIINDVLNAYKYEGGKEINDPQKLLILEDLVEKAKKELTFKKEESIKISEFDGEKDLDYILKRQNFNELNNESYNKIYKLINKALTDLIKEKYQDIDIITDLYDSIAYGNAIYTAKKLAILNNSQFENFKIYDITPISLGIRTEGDLMSVLLPRGSRVPIKVVKRFVTTQDNQNNIKFEIYEGERKLIKDNRKILTINLKNIPTLNKKQVKVEVTFEVNEEFLLNVTCKELSSNIEESYQVVINEDLTQKQILDMIEKSKNYNDEDKNEKERIKAMLKLNDKIFDYCHSNEGNEDILRELEEYRNWIKHNSHAVKEEYEAKLKELNDNMNQDKAKLTKKET